MTITIKAARDAKAGVWYIADSDLPGLNLEGESLLSLLCWGGAGPLWFNPSRRASD
jgi:hypothetical protein